MRSLNIMYQWEKVTEIRSLEEDVLDWFEKGKARNEESINAFDHEKIPNLKRSLKGWA